LTLIQVTRKGNERLRSLRKKIIDGKGYEPMYHVIDRLIGEKGDILEEMELLRMTCYEHMQTIKKLREERDKGLNPFLRTE